MKYVCRIDEGKIDAELARRAAERYSLDERLARMLVARGIDTEEKLSAFMSPGPQHFYDPYLLTGMREAAARVRRAIEDREAVVVYGDYDADGVCASAALCRFLSAKGVDVRCYIPERSKGYGLTEEAVEFIMEEFLPDLVITVDCGITGKAEVEYFQDLGADVVVTDHHRLPEELPPCVTVNPWLDGNYPFQELCGAGVAFKLIQALEPEAAEEYADLAAVATIADSMPLVGENRDIVVTGLSRMNTAPRACFTAYRAASGRTGAFTAEEVAYYFAPCLNAAGRFDSASQAFDYLVSEDEAELARLAGELVSLNERRKEDCKAFSARARGMISKRKQFTERFISVVDASLNPGIAGIAASKLTEMYGRPALVFTEDEEGVLKGSARSVPGIDLFAALSAVKDCLTAFGGHAQAAGLSLKKEDYRSFCKALSAVLAELPPERFTGAYEYDLDFCEDMTQLAFLRQIGRLEPYGYGFPRPVFRYSANLPGFVSLQKNPNYIRIQTEVAGFQPMCFTGGAYADVLGAGQRNTLLFELGTEVFRGEERLSCPLRHVGLELEENKLLPEAFETHFLEQLYYPLSEDCGSCLQMETGDFVKALDEALSGLYGTAVVCNTPEGFRFFREAVLPQLKNAGHLLATDYVRPHGTGSENAVILAASANLDYAAYSEVFFIDRPLNPGFAAQIVEKYETNVTLLSNGPDTHGFLARIDLDRACFAKYFRLVKGFPTLSETVALNYFEWFRIFHKQDASIALPQFVTCMLVFHDLGIIRFDKATGHLTYDRTKSGNIADSKFYQKLAAVRERKQK